MGMGMIFDFFVEHVKETWSSPVETRLPYLETSGVVIMRSGWVGSNVKVP